MNRRRLRKLANFLMTVKPERFNLVNWADAKFKPDHCGTAACACGWAVIAMPNSGLSFIDSELTKSIFYNGFYGWTAIRAFFDLDTREAIRLGLEDYYSDVHYLFDPNAYTKFHAGPKYVARRIFKFLELTDKNRLRSEEAKDKKRQAAKLAKKVKTEPDAQTDNYNGWRTKGNDNYYF